MTTGGVVLVVALGFLVFVGLGSLVYLAVSFGEAFISGKRHHLRKPVTMLAYGVVGASLLVSAIQVHTWVTGGTGTTVESFFETPDEGEDANAPRQPFDDRRSVLGD